MVIYGDLWWFMVIFHNKPPIGLMVVHLEWVFPWKIVNCHSYVNVYQRVNQWQWKISTWMPMIRREASETGVISTATVKIPASLVSWGCFRGIRQIWWLQHMKKKWQHATNPVPIHCLLGAAGIHGLVPVNQDAPGAGRSPAQLQREAEALSD